MDEHETVVLQFPLNYLYKFVLFLFNKLFRIDQILLLITNIIWIAVAFYCLKSYGKKHRNDLMRFAYVTFFINCLNSAMAVPEIFFENVMSSMQALLELLQASLALPCLTTEIWLSYNVAQKEVAWLHTIIGLIPTYIFLFQHYTRQDLIDFTVVMNVTSLITVGFLYYNIYAMMSSVLMFLGYTVFSFRSESTVDPITSKQLYNICMALYVFCGYESITVAYSSSYNLGRIRSRRSLAL